MYVYAIYNLKPKPLILAIELLPLYFLAQNEYIANVILHIDKFLMRYNAQESERVMGI